MKRFTRNKIGVSVLIAALGLLVAVPAFSSLYWDGFFTNLLVKGVLRLNGHVQPRVVTLTPVAGTGFTISETQDGVIFEVDPGHATIKGETDKCPSGIAGSGVTVWIVEPNDADRHGEVFFVRNIGSGTTIPLLRFTADQPLHTTTGTTFAMGEDRGDNVGIQRNYNSDVSGYVISEYEAD